MTVSGKPSESNATGNVRQTRSTEKAKVVVYGASLAVIRTLLPTIGIDVGWDATGMLVLEAQAAAPIRVSKARRRIGLSAKGGEVPGMSFLTSTSASLHTRRPPRPASLPHHDSVL